MGNDVVSPTDRISAVGIAGPIGWRASAHRGRPGRGRRLRRWVFLSSAVLTVAALAGCDSGHTVGKSAAPAASTTAGPTPTASSSSPPPASTGTTTTCVTSAGKGSCGPYRDPAITDSNGYNTYVEQDVWNPIPGWSQALHTTDPGSWNVAANMAAGNTAVVSYPSSSQTFSNPNDSAQPASLSQYSSIYSSFSENMNAHNGTSAEAAYDVWLNNWDDEIMLQHDIVNRGSACSNPVTATFGGSGGVPVQNWNLCVYGSERVWQLDGGREQSGSVDILAMLTWMVDHRYLPQNSTLTAIGYGFEICSTGGRPETFTVSHYSISAAYGGS